MYRLLDEEDLKVLRKPGQQMLWSLEHEAPTQVRQDDERGALCAAEETRRCRLAMIVLLHGNSL